MERRRGQSIMPDTIVDAPPERAFPNELPLGDLRHMTIEQSTFFINRALEGFVQERNGHSPHIDRDSTRFLQQITDFHASVNVRIKEEANPIRERYQKADVATKGKSTQEHLDSRIGNAELIVVSDSDGTLTDNNEDYLKISPGNEIGDGLLGQLGRDKFYDVFAATWKQVLERHPSLFHQVGQDLAHLRAGIAEFVRAAKDKGAQMRVLSANFEPIVQGILDQIPGSKDIILHAITPESIIPTEKGACLNEIALDNPRKSVVFIGDGSSDYPTLEAKENIAWYFALEESSFAKKLQEERVVHFSTFTDFNDIGRQLRLTAI